MSAEEMQLRIKGNEIRFIYSDLLQPLMAQGVTTTKRASNVEPCGNKWSADLKLVNGPILGPFETRREALDAEIKFLIANNIPVPSGD